MPIQGPGGNRGARISPEDLKFLQKQLNETDQKIASQTTKIATPSPQTQKSLGQRRLSINSSKIEMPKTIHNEWKSALQGDSYSLTGNIKLDRFNRVLIEVKIPAQNFSRESSRGIQISGNVTQFLKKLESPNVQPEVAREIREQISNQI